MHIHFLFLLFILIVATTECTKEIIVAEGYSGFWHVGIFRPYISFYGLDENSLQIQSVPTNLKGDYFSPFSENLNQARVKIQYNNTYMVVVQTLNRGADTVIIGNISFVGKGFTFDNYVTLPPDNPVLAVMVPHLILEQGSKYVLTMAAQQGACSGGGARICLILIRIYSITNKFSLLASADFDGTFITMFSNTGNLCYPEERNYIVDFLIKQTYPTLDFAAAAGDLNNNTIVVNLSYNYSTKKLAITNNIAVGANCLMLQNRVVGSHMWVLCVTPANRFVIRQLSTNYNYSTCCYLEISKYNFSFAEYINPYARSEVINWWLNEDGTRLLIGHGLNVAMYDTSACMCSGSTALVQKSPVLIYDYNTAFELGKAAIYNLQKKEYGALVAGISTRGMFQLFTDCPPGRHPTELHFCSRCVPGQSGIFCTPCPAGYLCDGVGLTVPSDLCPAGHYCESGSISNPPECDAGTYCPAGVATKSVTEELSSAKYCAAGFYCPAASTTPTAFICPNYSFSDVGARSIWDCECISGYYGFGGVCIPCPPECKCEGSTISLCWLPSEFGISDLHNKTIQPAICPSYSLTGTNQCNPDKLAYLGEGSFPCENGYRGRMCAQCEDGYFADGRHCHKCQPYLQWVLPLTYFVLTVLLGMYSWYDSPSKSAALKITLFHFQSLFALITSGLQWNNFVLYFVHSSSGATSLSYMAIECLIPEWDLLWSLCFALLTPLLALILGGLAWVMSWIVVLLPNTEFVDPQKRNVRVLKVAVFIVTLRYFNIATMIFSMIACTNYDVRDHEYFLNPYPWVSCSNDSYSIFLALALVGFVLEIIGLPLLYLFTVKAYRARLTESYMMEVLGSLYAVYKSKHYYWESVVISRRLLIAAIVSLVPFNSSWLYFGFFLVIYGYSVAHIIHKPYEHNEDNILDFTSQLVLLVSLFVGLLIGVNVLQPYQFYFSIILLLLNLGFLLFGVVIIFRYVVSGIRTWWEKRNWWKQRESVLFQSSKYIQLK